MRRLNQREQDMIRFLASDARPRADEVVSFLPHLRVVAQCDCGCDTVDLVDARESREWERQDAFSEAVDDTNGLRVHLLIDEDTARPTRLEVYGFDGARFPPLDRLRLLPA